MEKFLGIFSEKHPMQQKEKPHNRCDFRTFLRTEKYKNSAGCGYG